MKQCKINNNHWYANHLSECPWCRMAKSTGEDPFPDSSTIGQQVAFPPPPPAKPYYSIIPPTPTPVNPKTQVSIPTPASTYTIPSTPKPTPASTHTIPSTLKPTPVFSHNKFFAVVLVLGVLLLGYWGYLALTPEVPVRIWPSESPSLVCHGFFGDSYPPTGPNSATYFNFGGCGSWKIFYVVPGGELRIFSFTSENNQLGVAFNKWDVSYYIDDFFDGQWNQMKFVPQTSGGTDLANYIPRGSKIRIRTSDNMHVIIEQKKPLPNWVENLKNTPIPTPTTKVTPTLAQTPKNIPTPTKTNIPTITSPIDIVSTTYISYVNNESGFYRVRNFDKPPRDFTYDNRVLNINQGDTVIWENDANIVTLNIISDQNLWNSKIGQIKVGGRINYTFNKPGTYAFHIIIEGVSMRQTIIVAQTDSQIRPISTISSVTTSTSADQKTITNSIGMEFVLIPAGEFDMGAPENEKGMSSGEGPVHRVKISNAFYMGKYEVTQKQWREIMETSPSYFKGDNLPVEQVSWNDVQDFIRKLNEKEGGNKYRLPSEAEWEYSARAGTTTRYSFGDDESNLGDYAWYYRNSGSKTHDVGQKKPNPWGLYDMHGNVYEWAQDKLVSGYYGAPSDGSARESEEHPYRVIRGGCWGNVDYMLRSADRRMSEPSSRNNEYGFRLLRIL